jgi:alkanesulfonate monooxygenase SsuD/methylene tetrahydromethanopterin reductase-like flavin-dependent oxidoreductase (luciferase family)
MTKGRAAWNVVTSLNDGEAQNMGCEEVIEHDLRYDRADEFMRVVFGHWDSWEDDAIIQDKATGLFAITEKVHRLDHEGRFYRSRGPFTVPRSSSVIIQAGQSGRGKRFGAQWGELIFVVYPNIEIAKRDYADFKGEVVRFGRDPEHVKITQLVNVIAAATRMEAEDKWAVIDKLPLEIDALSLLSEALNFDFATKGMDEAFTDEEMADMSGLQTIRDRVVRASGNRNPTVREFLRGRPEGGCGPARTMGARARVRWLRDCRYSRSRRLRRVRWFRRAGAPASRAVPQGVRGQDLARPSAAASAADRRLAPVAHARAVIA